MLVEEWPLLEVVLEPTETARYPTNKQLRERRDMVRIDVSIQAPLFFN
jgi:hypothetical protein